MEEEGNTPKATRFGDTAGQARSVMKGAGAWLSTVSKRAKEAALVAGQQLDKAAITVGQRVDKVSQQLGDAYEQRLARDAAAKAEARALHRLACEAAYDEPMREKALTQGSNIIQECLNFAGEVQQEIQYAGEASPLGRESYGLMMLVNTLTPLLEHGMRPDWKAVIPGQPLPEAAAWARNTPYTQRYPAPSAFALLVALEHGWTTAAPASMGASAIEGLPELASSQRRMQAWIFQSLSNGGLAVRLNRLLSHPQMLADWYFPWAAVMQADTMNLLIEELVLIESRSGLISLPVDHLYDHSRDGAAATPIADRVRGGLAAAGALAGRAGQAIVTTASTVGSRVNGLRSARADGAAPVADGLQYAPAPTSQTEASVPSHDFGPSPLDSPVAARALHDGRASVTSPPGLTVHVNDTYTRTAPATADHFAIDDAEEELLAPGGARESAAAPATEGEDDAVAAPEHDAEEEAAAPALPPDLMFPGGSSVARADGDAAPAAEDDDLERGVQGININEHAGP